MPFHHPSVLRKRGETREDRCERDLRLGTREVRAQAEVPVEAKGEVSIRASADVESLGVGKAFGVAVRRTQHEHHRLSRLYRLARPFDFRHRNLRRELHRAVVA